VLSTPYSRDLVHVCKQSGWLVLDYSGLLAHTRHAEHDHETVGTRAMTREQQCHDTATRDPVSALKLRQELYAVPAALA
jgi:hypothetical protein